MIDLDKPCEGLDYDIQPFQHDNNEQAWFVKVLRGKWAGAMLWFTHVEFDGVSSRLRFQLNAIDGDSDQSYLLDTSDIDLQDFAFKVLQDIIRNGIANGSIVFDDKDTSNGTMAGASGLQAGSE